MEPKIQISKIFDKFFVSIFIILLAVELLSFFALPNKLLEQAVFILLVLAVTLLTSRKLAYGIYFLLAELFIGGLGYMFFWPLSEGRFSLRLAIFLAVLFSWMVKTIFDADFSWIKNKYFILVSLLMLIVAAGILRAYWLGRPLGDIMSDANAYLYLALVGAFIAAKIDIMKCVQLALACSLTVALKTIAVLYIFSHHFSAVGDQLIYRWVRDSRVGEITLISEPLYRIFFQSHFYNLIALCLIIAIVFLTDKKLLSSKVFWSLKILFWLNFLVLFISQTRSFWLAGFIAIAIFFGWLIYQKAGWKKIIMYIMIWPIMAVSCHFAVDLIIGDWNKNVFYERLGKVDSQSGISSRRAQLMPLLAEIKKSPLGGQGFAKNITYQSSDPRIKNKNNPEGWYTTYSFELGYLDLMLKLGIAGLAAFGLLLLYLLRTIIININNNPVSVGLCLGLATLIIIHAFTPYLNHPLGLGYILMMIGLQPSLSRQL